MARLIFVDGPWKGIEIGLDGNEIAVGRDPGCEIAIPDTSLSRRHFRLVYEAGGWAAEDLRSRNGTTINGEPLAHRPLRDGDRLVAGRHVAVFAAHDAGTDLGELTTVVGDEYGTDDVVAQLHALVETSARAPDAEEALALMAEWILDRTGGDRAILYRRRGGHLVPDSEGPARPPVPVTALAEAARHGNATWIGRGDRGVMIVPIGARADFVFAVPAVAPLQRDGLRVITLGAHVFAAELASRFRIEILAARLDDVTGDDGRMVASSPAMLPVLEFIERGSTTDSTVLLLGESGTGKELVARALHRNSERRERRFVAVNCAAIPAGLIEAELFGHERGAFTGAVSRRIGCFEAADGGTLLLDEIGELSAPAQAGLLRVLEDRAIQRLGGHRPMLVDVRIIAATHRDLRAAVEAGSFREDLYFRIAVLVATLPPLRERTEDIEALAKRFLARLSARAPRAVTGFTDDALAAMRAYAWPGNVRELRNVVERAVMLGRDPTIGVGDLPLEVRSTAQGVGSDRPGTCDRVELPMAARELERRNLLAALAATDGNKTRAAALLGIDRVTLYNRLRVLE